MGYEYTIKCIYLILISDECVWLCCFHLQNLFISNATISHLLMEMKQIFYVANSSPFLPEKEYTGIKSMCVCLTHRRIWIIHEHRLFFSNLFINAMKWFCGGISFELNFTLKYHGGTFRFLGHQLKHLL